MKNLIVLALALAYATAFDLRSEGRIAGGQDAKINEFGYNVGLILQPEAFASGHWCSGSIIAYNWVLTAAHCTYNMNYITVYLGAAERQQGISQKVIRAPGCDLQNPDPSKCNVIEHKHYNSRDLNPHNDISLIKISSVQESENIWPIKLPDKSAKYENYVNKNGIVSGWGRMGDSSSSLASNLQYTNMVVVDNQECVWTYGQYEVTDGNICLKTGGYSGGRRSTCRGDDGDPLVLQEGTYRDKIQIGLSSYGAKAGCEIGFPVMFTRIAHFLDWIVEITKVQ